MFLRENDGYEKVYDSEFKGIGKMGAWEGILCPILIFFKEDKLMKAKRKTFARRMLSLLFAAVLVGTAVLTTACGGKPTKKTTYTYNEYISMFPSTWNTHNGSTEADTYVQLYTEMGLYDMTFNEDRTTYMFIDEMAKGDPVDVTSDLTAEQKAKYGIGAGQNGKAWKVNLNPDATWENGTKITADDYVESMKLLLSPEIKNKRAIDYYSGDTAIYNAEKYYKSMGGEEYNKITVAEEYTDAQLEALVSEGKLYFSFDASMYDENEYAFSRLPIADRMKKYCYEGCDTENGTNLYDIIYAYADRANAYGYIQMTSETYPIFKENVTKIWSNITTDVAAYLNLIPHWYNLFAVESNTVFEYNKITVAEEYTDAQLEALVSEGKLYFSFDASMYDENEYAFSRLPIADRMKKYCYEGCDTENGTNLYDIIYAYADRANAYGYIQMTSETYPIFKENVTKIWSNITTDVAAYLNLIPHWYNLFAVETEVELETASFEDVGIFKNDEYSFTMVFENSLSLFDVKNKLRSNWIVYRPYYEAGMTTTGSLKSTNYGTTSGQYMSYGPYKLASYQKDKEFIFERNTNWYGYKEGKTNYRANQFQTDRIVGQVISNQSTALTEFLSGNIDQVRLTSNDLDTYRYSDYLLRRTGGNTWQLSLNGDPEALKKIEADGLGNRQILAVNDFRKALSLMIDRNYIGSAIAGNSQGALAFLNSNYFYDMENDADSIYRNTDEAKQGLLDLYGITYGADETYKNLDEAYSALTGYDLAAAKECFGKAVTEAVAKGYYSEGQNVRVNIYVTDLTAQMTALNTYMQKQVTEATKGTKLEGKVTIEFKTGSTNRYDDLRKGTIEGIYHSFVASYDDPAGFFASFTDPTKQPLEYGFKPNVETFSVTAVFDSQKGEETLTKTYDQWQKSIAVGGTYANNNELKLAILSALEKNILANFQAIPLYVGTDSLLFSKKVQYASTNANIFVAYGGIRLMTYMMNDGEWEDYCKNNKLQYV